MKAAALSPPGVPAARPASAGLARYAKSAATPRDETGDGMGERAPGWHAAASVARKRNGVARRVTESAETSPAPSRSRLRPWPRTHVAAPPRQPVAPESAHTAGGR